MPLCACRLLPQPNPFDLRPKSVEEVSVAANLVLNIDLRSTQGFLTHRAHGKSQCCTAEEAWAGRAGLRLALLNRRESLN